MVKKFAIIKGGIVDGIALAEAPIPTDGDWIDLSDIPEASRPGPLWRYENNTFLPPVVPPPVVVPNVITKVAFRFRFTDAEYAAILGAAKTDPEVQVWYDTFNMVSSIDLDNQRTKDGVANLVSKNLLTTERANEILTAPVQPNERA
jgi:hypothetical protein